MEKLKAQCDSEIEFLHRNHKTIDDFLYEEGTLFNSQKSASQFNSVDVIFIYGEPNLLPWSSSAYKVPNSSPFHQRLPGLALSPRRLFTPSLLSEFLKESAIPLVPLLLLYLSWLVVVSSPIALVLQVFLSLLTLNYQNPAFAALPNVLGEPEAALCQPVCPPRSHLHVRRGSGPAKKYRERGPGTYYQGFPRLSDAAARIQERHRPLS